MKPDIILFHCHDLGRWLPCYGMRSVPAPGIARFAASAVVFDDAHAAAPLCSPARAALFTGQSPYRNGVQGLAHDGWRYRAGVSTLPELLRPHGYHSALVGLQHENVDPTVIGFDECVGLGFLPRTEQVVDAGVQWLQGLASSEERDPVFATVGVWEVHRPWPAHDYDAADPATVEVPGYLPDNVHTRNDIASFYGSIAQMDAGFTRLLAAVDECLGAETMVIFTTDHGVPFPRAKSTLYDAGTGVSLIIRPPASWGSAPAHVPDLVSHQDIVPTILELAGASPQELDGFEGVSLLSRLRGGATADRPVGLDRAEERILFTSKTYHDSFDPKRAARSCDYVYIKNYADGPLLELAADLEGSETRRGMGEAHLDPRPPEELYDRRKDPDELVNVISDDAHASARERLRSELRRWLEVTGDPIETEAVPRVPARSRHVDDLPALPS